MEVEAAAAGVGGSQEGGGAGFTPGNEDSKEGRGGASSTGAAEGLASGGGDHRTGDESAASNCFTNKHHDKDLKQEHSEYVVIK